MTMKIAIANLLGLPDRSKIVFDVEDELQFHIEMLERKFTQHGMSATEAKLAALRRFGNLERIKRQCVDISKRKSLLQRTLKTSSLLIALTGIAIHVLNSNYKVARIGNLLLMVAVLARLLIYVRGL